MNRRDEDDELASTPKRYGSPTDNTPPTPASLEASTTLGTTQMLASQAAIRLGVPDAIIQTQQLYFDALSADAASEEPGSIEDACRNTFAMFFAAPTSPLSPHIDDMLWYVRTPQRARDAEAQVFLQRRGLETDLMLQQAEEEAGISNQSFAASVSSSFRARMNSGNLEESPAKGNLPGGRITGIRWRETLALNIATQWVYTLSVSVVRILKVNGVTQPVVIRDVTKRVYASPAKAMFQDKEQRAGDFIDYPNLYFNIDDFEDVFGGIQLCEGYAFAVLLTAGASSDSNATVFRGLLMYDAIMNRVIKGVQAKGVLPTADNKEFIPLLGPEKKGKAEIAVCISDADVYSFSDPAAQTKASTMAGSDTRASSGGGGILKSLTSVFSSKSQAPTLSGGETLQCFLTHVSVNVHHVTSVLCANAPLKHQWLYVPSSRKELDAIICHEDNQRDDQSPKRNPSAEGTVASQSGGASPQESPSANEAKTADPTASSAPGSPAGSSTAGSERRKSGGPKALFQSLKTRLSGNKGSVET